MRIHFISPIHFERWDYRNSVEQGIGGSETSHVEMAWRLARRGHEVISYAPIPDDCVTPWRGTHWWPLEQVEQDAKTSPGLWIIYRHPAELDKFEKRDDQRIWFVAQDEAYYAHWTEDRLGKIELVMALCEEHKQHMLRLSPQLEGKLVISSNGIKLDLIEEVEAAGLPERNPNRLMYASSPDRGLLVLLKIFKRAREYNEQLELNVFYGTNNIEKLIDLDPKFSRYKGFLEKLKRGLDQPGVTWHGRVSQQQLCLEWLKTGIWCYPTSFFESACITAAECQALGAIPITRPYGALLNNVRHGVFIQGDPENDPLVQARYVKAILQVASSDIGQANMRQEMMPWARQHFDWERWVDQWCGWMETCPITAPPKPRNRLEYQRDNVTGRILNIGCANDPAGLGEDFGAVNLDLHEFDPVNRVETAASILADARDLPYEAQEFDTAVLGDILEHMSDEDAIQCLREATRIAKRIVITVPEDHRPVTEQAFKHPGSETTEYAAGILAWHPRPITREIIEGWLTAVDLQALDWERLDDQFFESWGLVAIPAVAALAACLEAQEITV